MTIDSGPIPTPFGDEKKRRMVNAMPYCCSIDCELPAEFTVYTLRKGGGFAGPDIYSDDTQACETHVGSLLGWQPAAQYTDDIYWEVVALQ